MQKTIGKPFVTRIPERGSGDDVKRWRASIRFTKPDGSPGSKSKDFRYKDDAEAHKSKLAKEAARLVGGACEEWINATVAELAAENHRLRVEEGGIRPNTQRSDAAALKLIRRLGIGSKRVADLTVEDVRRFVFAMKSGGDAVGARTREMTFNFLRETLGLAEDMGLIGDGANPAAGERVRRMARAGDEEQESIKPDSTDKLFSQDELGRILEAVDNPEPGDGVRDVQFATLVHLLAGAALRIGEALALTWGDIDLRERTVCVTGTLVRDSSQPKGSQWVKGEPKTASSAGTVPIDDELARRLGELKTWRAAESGATPHATAFVFQNTLGKPLAVNDLRRRKLYPLLERLGIKRGRRSFHAFRHSRLSHVHEAGVPLATVAKLARHKHAGITGAIYAHGSDDAARLAVEMLAERRSAGGGNG